MATTPLPIPNTPYDPQHPTLAWQNFFQSLATLTINAAPVDARYVVTTHNPSLTSEINLGVLTTGFVFITVAAGIATVTSSLSGASLTGLNASNLASGTVPDGRFPATLPALNGSNLTSLNAAALVGGGTYTPTLTNATNVTASTAYTCQYSRNGATVTVSGKVDVDPTAAGATVLGISLPIASNFAAAEQCGGVAFAPGIAGQGAGIEADATNDRASMQWTAVDVTNQSWFFVFQYLVV